MRSPSCLRVCLSPISTSEPIGGVLWNSVGKSCYLRWPRCHQFNVVAATIPKWRTFKLLRWMQGLHHPT
jgi:hypothetical protein